VIVGILLAAGASSRFGARKLLHPLADETPMLLRSASNMAAALMRTVVIVAPGDAALVDLAMRAGADLCACERSCDGMGASLACGVRASAHARGWIVALADMPFIEPATIRAVAQAIAAGAPIAAPTHASRRGHPVGFAREYYAELSSLSGDEGARRVVERDRKRVVLVPVADAGIHRDIDTPADLA
jgi:molybdenum cofactor cytidylyltransferase